MRKSPLQKISENYCRSNLFQIILLKIKQTKETINIPNTQNCILNVQACSFKVFTVHKKNHFDMILLCIIKSSDVKSMSNIAKYVK